MFHSMRGRRKYEKCCRESSVILYYFLQFCFQRTGSTTSTFAWKVGHTIHLTSPILTNKSRYPNRGVAATKRTINFRIRNHLSHSAPLLRSRCLFNFNVFRLQFVPEELLALRGSEPEFLGLFALSNSKRPVADG